MLYMILHVIAPHTSPTLHFSTLHINHFNAPEIIATSLQHTSHHRTAQSKDPKQVPAAVDSESSENKTQTHSMHVTRAAPGSLTSQTCLYSFVLGSNLPTWLMGRKVVVPCQTAAMRLWRKTQRMAQALVGRMNDSAPLD